MQAVTDYVLGADIAWLMIATGVLALVGIVRGALAARTAPHPEPGEARMLAGLDRSLVTVPLLAAVPVAGLLLLVPASDQDRWLRSLMVLAGVAVVWGAGRLARPIGTAGRAALSPALGLGLTAVAVLPVLALLRQSSADALLGLAAGAALTAVAAHAVSAAVSAAGSSAALLAGTAELGQDAADADSLGADHLARARILETWQLRTTDLTAAATVLVAIVSVVSVPVLAAEGLLLAVLGLAAALLVALVVPLLPAVRSTAASLAPTLVIAGALVAAGVVWLPTTYARLRFDQVGMGSFTDPAVAGAQPIPRADFEAQLEGLDTSIAEFVGMTNESREASAFLDVLGLYRTSPAVMVGVALALGALLSLVVALAVATSVAPGSGSVRAAARTSRTGGALGLLAALGGTGLRAGALVGLAAVVVLALSVLGAGIPQLLVALLALAALGALVVAAGLTSTVLRALSPAGDAVVTAEVSETARADGEHDADEDADEERGSIRVLDPAVPARGPLAVSGTAMSAASLVVVTMLGALALISPLLSLIDASGRGTSIWEDRAAHSTSAGSGFVIAAIALTAVALLLTVAAAAEGGRRLGSRAVVATREASLENRLTVHLDELPFDVRRMALPITASGALLPAIIGFGVGPAALPAMVAAGAGLAALLALTAIMLEGVLAGALATIEEGRYGGRDSWAHTGALGNTVLGTILRGAATGTLTYGVIAAGLLAVLAGPTLVALVASGTDPLLRWGAGLVAALILLAVWVYLLVSDQPDLEDQVPEQDRTPLFSTLSEERAGLDDDELDAAQFGKAAQTGKTSRRR